MPILRFGAPTRMQVRIGGGVFPVIKEEDYLNNVGGARVACLILFWFL